MIREIDDALRELVKERALDGSDVEVVLDAPTTDWAARRNAPTINMFLYDIREDTRFRERGYGPRTGPDGEVIGRMPPPRMFKLSYLVTAWTSRPEDEHRLLDSLLNALLGQEVIPPELIGGDLTGARISMSVGLPPPEDRGFADVWSSLGGQLKPSVDVVVTAPFSAGAMQPVGPPVEEPTVVRLSDRLDGGEDRMRRHVPPPLSKAAMARGFVDPPRRGTPPSPRVADEAQDAAPVRPSTPVDGEAEAPAPKARKSRARKST